MLGTDQKNVVPQRVYLYPIKYIKANPLMALLKDATAVITKKAAKLLEEIIQINQQATHVLEANTTSYHQRLRMQCAVFIDCVERYQAWYAGQLVEILPEIMRQKALDQSAPLKK